MDDILNGDFGVDTVSPFTPMSDLVATPETPAIQLPQGAIRNRAATSALLQGDPNKVIDSYQVMMQEGLENSSNTHDQIQNALAAKNKQDAIGPTLKILGDKTVPLDQKRKLFDLVQRGDFKIDSSISLQGNSLQAPNPGESLQGEAVRIKTADALGELYKERQDRQKMVNGLLATLPEASIGTVGEVAEADVLPFGRNIIGANIAQAQRKAEGVPSGMFQWVKDFILPGSTRADIQRKLNNIPPQNRKAYSESLLNSVRNGSALFFNDNYYSQYQEAVGLLNEDAPTKTQEWTSNMLTVLDAFWVGDAIRGVGKTATAARQASQQGAKAGKAEDVAQKASWELVDEPINRAPPSNQIPSGQKRLTYNTDDIEKRIKLQAPVRREQPVSPYSVIEQVNPAQAKSIMEAVQTSGDEVAQAMTGVNREQALTNATFPQVGSESGAVLNKANLDLDPFINNTGAIRYTESEFAGAVDTVQTDFRAATGLEINDAMTTFRIDGDRLAIDAHYTTAGGAWVTPEAAKAQAMYALRKYGIQPGEVTVLERQGMEYVPATGDTAKGDYIIKVNTNHPIQDNEVVSWNPLDVKRNWLDRISFTGSDTAGTAVGHIFDPASTLHPTITGSASVAVDKAVVLEDSLLKPIKILRDQVSKFPTARRRAVEEYMIEANTQGLKYDRFDLKARGFSDAEADSLKLWRDVWDGHYYLENLDLVRTMTNQGYSIIETSTDRFFAKAVPKNQSIGKVYDVGQGKVVSLTQSEMDTLYNTGGSYASLRRPINVAGDQIEHIVVRNTPTEYLRKIRETDPVLNYREGYYTVNYKAPKFVDEISIGKDGKEVRKTVAVAGTTEDADMFAKAQEAATGNRHMVREDKRGFTRDDDYWDINEVSGRIAQRMRGKPLYEAKGINNLGVGSYIQNPMESAVRAARSISGRTVTRPMLETAKRRFVQQYGEFLKPTPFGPRQFPSSRNEIVDVRSHTSSEVADARTTWDYINYLEKGYINSADEFFKGGMNVLADWLGKYHLSGAERVARGAGEIAPTHKAKATVFQAYIALSNPIRQWIVQSHQGGRTFAYNPIGWATGQVPAYVAKYLGVKVFDNLNVKGAQEFFKFVEGSGMVAGVDKNSLVRGMGLDMADYTYGAKKFLTQAASLPQQAGFDVGEKLNQLVHLAAVYERRTRAGQNLADKTLAEQAYSEARALSYDLNRAGELHYTQSSMATILQFLQMPHKAILQGTNRRLPWDVKARMTGMDIILFGPPIAAISSLLYAAGQDGDDLLPNDQTTRDLVTAGVSSYIYNTIFTHLDDSGDTTRVDLSGLSPYGFDGWARMLSAMSDKGVLGMVASSPAGQILAVDGSNGQTRNGRIPQAILTMGRYVGVFDEIDPQNPTEVNQILRDVAKISSGWSAADKAIMMLETRRKFDSQGVSADSVITGPEIAAAFLGFGTMDEKQLYEVSQGIAKSKKAHDDELMSKYRDIMRYYADAHTGDTIDVQHIQKVSSLLMRTFRNPEDLDKVTKQFWIDVQGRDASLGKKLFDAAGMPNLDRTMDLIKQAPLDQNTKDALIQRMKDAKAQRAYSIPEPEGK